MDELYFRKSVLALRYYCILTICL